ncbi:MAG: S9 family peptidase, partial [Bacteroidales bacterium]|nr:S9 family peptidase [Bacteroidales bacterium]
MVYQNLKQPLRSYGAGATEDGRFVLLYESETTSGNALYVKDLVKKQKDFTQIMEGFEFTNSIIDNIDDKLLMMTNKNAPKNQLVLIDPAAPAVENWKVILPEKNEVLLGAALIGGKVVATYMKDASSKVFVYNLDGSLVSELELPTIGTVGGFSGKKDESVAYYAFTSFTYPTVIFKLDMNTLESTVHIKPEVDFDI